MTANPVYEFDGLTHSQRAIVLDVARLVNGGADIEEIEQETGLPQFQIEAILREPHFAIVCAHQRRVS